MVLRRDDALIVIGPAEVVRSMGGDT